MHFKPLPKSGRHKLLSSSSLFKLKRFLCNPGSGHQVSEEPSFPVAQPMHLQQEWHPRHLPRRGGSELIQRHLQTAGGTAPLNSWRKHQQYDREIRTETKPEPQWAQTEGLALWCSQDHGSQEEKVKKSKKQMGDYWCQCVLLKICYAHPLGGTWHDGLLGLSRPPAVPLPAQMMLSFSTPSLHSQLPAHLGNKG